MPNKRISNNKIEANPFGGGDILIDMLLKNGVDDFINSHLGQRAPRAEYTYAEGIITWFISKLCGARGTENIYYYHNAFRNHPRFQKAISPDTFLYMCSKKFTNFACSRGLKYITRAKSTTVANEKKFIRNWKNITIKNRLYEIGEDVFHFGKNETRMIIKKDLKKRNADGSFKCFGLITNDFEAQSQDIISLYSKRGESESLFSDLNQFGWSLLPMRKFSHNTVYLYISAFGYILFKSLKKLLHSKAKMVYEKMKVRTFKDKFLRVVTVWVKGKLEYLSRKIEYEGLSGFT